MKISQRCVDLVKRWEGCKLKAYQDVVGVWTIGYGSTGPDIKEGLEWTYLQAEERLKKDLQRFEDAVNQCVKTSVTQNEFDALVSWCYNVGPTAVKNSTLIKMLNAGVPRKDVADQLLRWDKAGGRQVFGLTNRRRAERDLFLEEATKTISPSAEEFKPVERSIASESSEKSEDFLTVLVNLILGLFKK